MEVNVVVEPLGPFLPAKPEEEPPQFSIGPVDTTESTTEDTDQSQELLQAETSPLPTDESSSTGQTSNETVAKEESSEEGLEQKDDSESRLSPPPHEGDQSQEDIEKKRLFSVDSSSQLDEMTTEETVTNVTEAGDSS